MFHQRPIDQVVEQALTHIPLDLLIPDPQGILLKAVTRTALKNRKQGLTSQKPPPSPHGAGKPANGV
jgi:hypothetical protein